MKVLVVGSGGREHALAWKIAQSPLLGGLYCAPGNAGTAALGRNLDIGPGDLPALLDFALKEGIDLTVVGPEAPLVAGIADAFAEAGLMVFGPTREGARMEGSKAFAKELMLEEGIPTGRAETFVDLERALGYVRSQEPPLVVKADGLAAGKGVTVAATLEEAEDALRACLQERRFGGAGDKVLVEEFLEGQEASLLTLVDGEDILPLEPAQDYKRIGEGDTGPNTGGMGSYSPVPALDEDSYRRVVEEILRPTARALVKRGIHFRGILYAGVILTAEGPKVLEFNVRFGDPETQAVLPRLRSDLLEAMLAVCEGKLSGLGLEWAPEPCVTVVIASGGYPGDYAKGHAVKGLEEAARVPGVVVFHAGTALGPGGEVLTAGGRVFNVSAWGEDFRAAREKAYAAAEKISFEDRYYRGDIALRVIDG